MIAAAGSGERLGAGGPKAFVELAGRPLLEWSLEACRAADSIGEIVVAVPPGEEGAIDADLKVVAGGETRSASVSAALSLVETPLVAVHDAARPLVTPELIDVVVADLAANAEADGVIAAAPVTDTLKPSQDGREIHGTLDRTQVWAAQTPQAFRTIVLRQAHESGDAQHATDDAMLVEGLGKRVLLHAAPLENHKVTTQADLRLAELLLRERVG